MDDLLFIIYIDANLIKESNFFNYVVVYKQRWRPKIYYKPVLKGGDEK